MGLPRDLAAWWADRMAELLPEQLRRGEREVRDALVAEMRPAPDGAPALWLFLRRAGRESALGPVAPNPTALRAALPARRPAAVLLRPPVAALLEREVLLPPAAEPELDRVLAHEMNRLTPFAATDLYWRWEIAKRDRARGRLRVRLSLVPRAALAAAVAALAGAGAAPTALSVRRPDGTARELPVSQPGEEAGTGRRRTLALASAGCAALALAAAVLPFAQQERALDRTAREVEALRPAVAEAEAMRRRIAAAGSDVLAAEAARVGSALDALATLTTLLSDDTFLTALGLRERRLTLTGQSAAAARLIPALSADPAIREPAFLAPVTRAEGRGGEIFSLRAELAP